MRPRLLDLFCGAGGAAMGYHRAGFDVVGVDIRPQPRYPFPFLQGNAMEVLDMIVCDNWRLPFANEEGGVVLYRRDFDAIHASPPCQAYSIARNNGSGAGVPMLIDAVRDGVRGVGLPYVIENVEGARKHMAGVMLCGASFDLGASGMELPRHRLFECSFPLFVPQCQHERGNTMGVYGHGTNSWHRKKIGRNLSIAEMRRAMGIDWMTRAELGQAIPPAFTEYVGRYLLTAVGERAA